MERRYSRSSAIQMWITDNQVKIFVGWTIEHVDGWYIAAYEHEFALPPVRTLAKAIVTIYQWHADETFRVEYQRAVFWLDYDFAPWFEVKGASEAQRGEASPPLDPKAT